MINITSITRGLFILLTKKQKIYFFFLVFLFFVSMLLETVGVVTLIPVLELLNNDNLTIFNKYNIFDDFQNNITNTPKENLIILFLLIFFSFYLIKTIFLASISFLQVKFISNIYSSISEVLFKIYIFKPLDFYLNNNSAKLTKNINDVSGFITLLKSFLLLLTELIISIGLFIFLLVYNPFITILLVFLLSSLSYIFFKLIQKFSLIWGVQRSLHAANRLQHINQGFKSIRDIKILGKEIFFVKIFSFFNKKTVNVEGKQTFILSLPKLFLELIFVFGLVLLIFYLVIKEQNIKIIIPTVGVYSFVTFRLLPSFSRIINSFQQLSFLKPILDSLVNEFINYKNSELSNKIKNKNNIVFKNKIELKKIFYKYSDTNKYILKNINLKFSFGDIIGIYGKSGSGKTTLLNILLGLLNPQLGEILVDDKNILNYPNSWKNQIGYVPQNVYLLDDTLKKNICLGIPDNKINMDKLKYAIKFSLLDTLVNNYKHGINSNIGEMGERISGGQKQRIAIARAIYNDPKLIILDEPTSSLDSATEKMIIKNLYNLRKKKTIIIISHNISTLSMCNKVYNLSKAGLKLVKL
jgi:ABC-type bacteriocin/lantibiotic exporter with double-glycine peptidase domain